MWLAGRYSPSSSALQRAAGLSLVRSPQQNLCWLRRALVCGGPVDPLGKGGTVILIFVRSDCPVSNRYAPTLKTMSQEYAGKAQFVLVYPDKDETSATIEKHLQEYGYHFAAIRDPQHALVKESKVQITPEVAVFNGKRELIYHGRIDNWYEDFGRARSQPTTHELDEAIRAAVNGTPAPAPVSGVGCYISDLQ